MKLGIVGSSNLNLAYPLGISDFVTHFIGDAPKEVITTGESKGINKAGEEYAGCRLIPVKRFEADYYNNGQTADSIRNKKIAKYIDKLLLVWNNNSPELEDLKEEMLKLRKPIFEVVLLKHNEDK